MNRNDVPSRGAGESASYVTGRRGLPFRLPTVLTLTGLAGAMALTASVGHAQAAASGEALAFAARMGGYSHRATSTVQRWQVDRSVNVVISGTNVVLTDSTAHESRNWDVRSRAPELEFAEVNRYRFDLRDMGPVSTLATLPKVTYWDTRPQQYVVTVYTRNAASLVRHERTWSNRLPRISRYHDVIDTDRVEIPFNTAFGAQRFQELVRAGF
jgi:hypothetical protein